MERGRLSLRKDIYSHAVQLQIISLGIIQFLFGRCSSLGVACESKSLETRSALVLHHPECNSLQEWQFASCEAGQISWKQARVDLLNQTHMVCRKLESHHYSYHVLLCQHLIRVFLSR